PSYRAVEIRLRRLRRRKSFLTDPFPIVRFHSDHISRGKGGGGRYPPTERLSYRSDPQPMDSDRPTPWWVSRGWRSPALFASATILDGITAGNETRSPLAASSR